MRYASRIWACAASRIPDKTINLSRLSAHLGVRIATLWTYHHACAKWSADLWLKSLIATGNLDIEGDKITITCPPDVINDIAASEVLGDLAYRNKKGSSHGTESPT